jgi:hypothetical protein
VSDVLEGGLVLHVMTHHGMLGRSVGVPGWGAGYVLIWVILVVQVLLAHEVLGPFMLVGSAILRPRVSEMKIENRAGNPHIDSDQ